MTLVASTYAVDTQSSRSSPPRSPTIIGSALPSTVASSEDMSPASMSPPNTSFRCRPVIGAVVSITRTSHLCA